jgi:hypothetical protein
MVTQAEIGGDRDLRADAFEKKNCRGSRLLRWSDSSSMDHVRKPEDHAPGSRITEYLVETIV